LVHFEVLPESSLVNLVIRKASVRWKGGAVGGRRAFTKSGGLLRRTKCSFGLSPSNGSHTDPVELIAAAHASSYSLALSEELKLKPSAAGEIITTATVTLEHLAAGWTIVNIHLDVTARLPKVTQVRFIDATVRAETSCPICRLVRATISMSIRLTR
jgi:osmotically inducible protein OsmC